MRGGPFAETRVIELLNRRFVPYFFNTGGPGEGHDDAARSFVAGKVPNRWAYFAAFAPDGHILGATGIYDGTDEVFAFLRALLRRHPEFDHPTDAERLALARSSQEVAAADALAAGRIGEELAKFAAARQAYERALTVGDAAERATARRGLLRVARGDGDWPAHAAAIAAAASSGEAVALAVDLAIERGLHALAQRRFATARVTLESAIAAAQPSPRLAELHYEAGRACWFLGDRDQAKAHWCWILELRPDDRLAQRARLAAGADGFPYPNQELGGFEGKSGPVGPGALDDAVAGAQRIWQQRRAQLLAGEFDLDAVRKAAATEPDLPLPRRPTPTTDPADGPDSLVARLANPADDAAQARAIDQLAAAGQPAAMALVVAVGNEDFTGRLAAVVALGRVFASGASIDAETRGYCQPLLAKLARGRGDDALAAAAQKALHAFEPSGGQPAPRSKQPPVDAPEPFTVQPEASTAEPPATAPARPTTLPKSPLLLVASLRDGNEHRIANNEVVDALVRHGEQALAPLQAAVADTAFPGRGYAAWALGTVLASLPTRPPAAIDLLREATRDIQGIEIFRVNGCTPATPLSIFGGVAATDIDRLTIG